MKETTLCYIENNGKLMMMFRGSKADDPNQGKWIGVGGKLEPGETHEECVKREVREETGLENLNFLYHGVIHFRSDQWEDEDMFLYSAVVDTDAVLAVDGENAVVADREISVAADCCDEGTLEWIEKDNVMDLPMWEGDRIFLEELFAGRTGLEITLHYEGEKLAGVERKEL